MSREGKFFRQTTMRIFICNKSSAPTSIRRMYVQSCSRKEKAIVNQQDQSGSGSATAQAQQPVTSGQQQLEPNLFELSNHDIHVTYSTTSFSGQPQLNYHSSTGILNFQGQDIRVEQSELGSLVTVSIMKTVDTGYTSLTV